MLNFSTPVAVFLTLFAAAMWGSWMQVVKLKRDYPINGIIFWLYNFSLILIWGVTLLFKHQLLPEGIMVHLHGNGTTIVQILFGGFIMGVGMLMNLNIMHRIGMVLSTAFSGAIGCILGLATSISKEGMPTHPMAMPLIVACSVVFIAAGVVCQYASVLRDTDKAVAAGKKPEEREKSPVTVRVIGIMLFSALLQNGWSYGTATGIATGFPPALTCALMATGSFLGSLAVCSFMFTKNHQWKTVFCIGTSKKPYLYSAISAFCHYGGNLISIYTMPAISATMSFLFGRSSSVWTYFWGIFYGEFAGSRKKTIFYLILGLFLYFLAVALLGVFNIAIR